MTDTRPLCANGHRWLLVRKYIGIEDYDVKVATNAETGDDIPLDRLQPGSTGPSFDVLLADDRTSDGYDGVLDEWLECKYCPAEIRGDRIGEIE